MNAKGVGTKAVGYAGPQYAPFRCSHCQWFKASRSVCGHPEVIADPETDKTMVDGEKKAVVDPRGCCNEFRPD